MDVKHQRQRFELMRFLSASGEEMTGLSVELEESSTGVMEVRVLFDPLVISDVTVTPLQQGGCCG